MGTGPFKFTEWQPTINLKVVKNPAYFHKGLPYLDSITFTFYPDETARVTALRTGAVDLIDYVPWKQQAAVERDPNLKLHSDKEMLFMWLTFRMDKPPFDNPKVRQAIAWAVDRQAVVKNVFFGRGEIMTGGMTPKSFPNYVPELEGTYDYNPDKAKALLKEAGYPNGFKTKILSTFQYDMHERTGEIVQGEFEMLVMGSAPAFRDGDFLTPYLRTGSVWTNRNKFSDAKIDALLDKARVTMDEKERKALYKQVEERMLSLSPAVLLCRREQAEATQKYVEGYTHIPGIYESSLTLEVTWLNK
jgi:glutathione transport system substrate-binding protein